jgi:hypothetical protein
MRSGYEPQTHDRAIDHRLTNPDANLIETNMFVIKGNRQRRKAQPTAIWRHD